MDDHQPLARAVLDAIGPHQLAAVGGAVAGDHVNMHRPQAAGAVIAVTAVCERYYRGTASLARKALILDSPADGSASRSKK
jgi:hypothetical protein